MSSRNCKVQAPNSVASISSISAVKVGTQHRNFLVTQETVSPVFLPTPPEIAAGRIFVQPRVLLNEIMASRTLLAAMRLASANSFPTTVRSFQTSSRRLADTTPLPARKPVGAFRGGLVLPLHLWGPCSAIPLGTKKAYTWFSTLGSLVSSWEAQLQVRPSTITFSMNIR